MLSTDFLFGARRLVWEHSSKVTFLAGEALHVRAGTGPKVTLPAPSFYSQEPEPREAAIHQKSLRRGGRVAGEKGRSCLGESLCSGAGEPVPTQCRLGIAEAGPGTACGLVRGLVCGQVFPLPRFTIAGSRGPRGFQRMLFLG